MKLKLSVFFLVALAAASSLPASKEEEPLDWWQTSIIYQIYPRSFKDGDGDGVGDLKGIAQNLEHLKETGLGATWISPIYKSPMVDFGYDIADFRDIDPLFGTMEDFDNLLKKAKELGIKLIMDFVPNHTSDLHEWFQRSVAGEERYKDYYTWRDGKIDPDTNERVPPNNWVSQFSGSAWEWNEERQQYYFHQFERRQPDLNYSNPLVVEEMKDVIRFWLDKGVDGFRVDAILYMFEDSRELDEPLTNNPDAKPGDWDSVYHIYTYNQPEVLDMVQQWREVMDGYKAQDGQTRVLMLEAWSTVEDEMAYYGTSSRPGGHFPFNFLFISNLSNHTTAQELSDTVHQWMDKLPEGRWADWVLGNHDQHRVASRVGPELADALNMVGLLLPGTAVTYNGEEIGMEDTFITWEQTKDPQGLNAGPDRYLQFTRDPERTPFQWDDSDGAGFSSNPDTWLPLNPNYKTVNLAAQKQADRSHYKVYRKLVEARQVDTIQRGSLDIQPLSTYSAAFTRKLEGSPTYVVVLNLGSDIDTVDLTPMTLPDQLKVHIASINADLDDGSVVNSSSVKLLPKSAYVLISE